MVLIVFPWLCVARAQDNNKSPSGTHRDTKKESLLAVKDKENDRCGSRGSATKKNVAPGMRGWSEIQWEGLQAEYGYERALAAVCGADR